MAQPSTIQEFYSLPPVERSYLLYTTLEGTTYSLSEWLLLTQREREEYINQALVDFIN